MHTNTSSGFTLIETMVAISLLTVAIVAPMMLTVQSLASAYYSRDQITAFYLAQEAIETIRQIRDGNILKLSQNISDPNCNPITLFCGVPVDQYFTIDATNNKIETASDCSDIATRPLKTYNGLYGYGSDACAPGDGSWTVTNFTRTVHACYVQVDGTCSSAVSGEMRIIVTMTWQTGKYQQRTFTISEDLYRWIKDGSGA